MLASPVSRRAVSSMPAMAAKGAQDIGAEQRPAHVDSRQMTPPSRCRPRRRSAGPIGRSGRAGPPSGRSAVRRPRPGTGPRPRCRNRRRRRTQRACHRPERRRSDRARCRSPTEAMPSDIMKGETLKKATRHGIRHADHRAGEDAGETAQRDGQRDRLGHRGIERTPWPSRRRPRTIARIVPTDRSNPPVKAAPASVPVRRSSDRPTAGARSSGCATSGSCPTSA